jgi:hypothetical protein
MVWLHILFFPQSIHPLLWPFANKEQACVCFVCIMASPAHVANFSLHKSHTNQSQTSYQVMHFSGLQMGGNLGVLDRNSWVDGVQCSNKYCDGFSVFKLVCYLAKVTLKQDFCWILVWPTLFEMLTDFCQHHELTVSSVSITSTRINPSQSKKTNHDLAHWQRIYSSMKMKNGVIPYIDFSSQAQNDGPRIHLL